MPSPELIGGRYELLDRLGSGGMGEVFRSRDRITDEIVALKRALREPVPPDASTVAYASTPATSTERAAIARLALASEFRVLSSLRHPNVVSVLDYGFHANGAPFFTMSLLKNPVTIVKAARAQPLDVQLDLLFQMLHALSYLHRHGIVHRDLKPSNVLVMGRHVTVLDFGVAGLPESTVAGTAGFLAPEVAGGTRPTPASDFYAVGGIAFEILTGQSMFVHEVAGIAAEMRGLDEAGPVGTLIKKLLSADPAARGYTDANLLIDDLARAAGRELPPESDAHRDSYLKAAPLIGRRNELTLLSNALESAVAGNGSAWLIGGESGVGKSRLLDEIRSRAQVRGLLALSGAAEDNQAPYALFRPVVSRLALLVDLSDSDAATLKVVFPEIERLLGRAVPSVAIDPQVFQERLTDVIGGLFLRYGKPMLVELEDCHFIGASLPILQALTDLSDRLPLVIVASFRDNERAQLASECPGMRLLRLSRFSAGEIRDIAESMLGRELRKDPEIVTFLERETEGNAFFLIEAVRELAHATGRMSNVSPDRLPDRVFSGGMQTYVRRRLDRLPAWARRPLELAGVIGRQVDLEVLHAAAPDADLDALLVVCGNAAILEGYGYHWRFTHDKLREALLAEMDRETRRESSRIGAAAIEAVYGAAPEWIHTQAVLWKEGGVTDKAAHYLLLTAAQLLSTGSPQVALQRAVEAAAQLDVVLPETREAQGAAIGAEMGRIQALMADRGPHALANLPRLTDERIGRVIGILMLIGPAAHISQSLELFALSTLTSFRLTLEHGVGGDAPKVIAMYAAVVREMMQDSPMALALTTLAMDLDRQLHRRVSAPVLFLHAWFVNHWINPLNTNLAFARDGARIGLNEQDILYGCFNAAAHVIYLSFSGAPLPQIVQEADRQLARIAGQVRVAAFHCLLERQVALALMGKTRNRLSLSDDGVDETRDLASICNTANHNQIGYYFLARLRLHYHYGEYETALSHGDRAQMVLPAFQGQVGEWEFVFYRALASAARALEVDPAARGPLLDTAAALLAKFETWATIGPANFMHKRDLIRAELLRARGDHAASAAFATAMQSAARCGFLHDEALAHERAALFSQAAGRSGEADERRDRAAALYEKWEAWAKAGAVRTGG